jgi:Protein of unknown function (DUF3891)
MLVRADASGTLLIGQPSHGWVSGQLARAWGNAAFGAVAPFEEVCLAAEQHDIGMAEWDLAPMFNPQTGLPYAFDEMPLDVHLPLWRAAPRRLLRQSRYAALLTSMHGVRLYGLRNLARLPAEDAAEIRAYFDAERRWQAEIAASLELGPEEIARNSQLIWTWDYMSLAVLLGWPPCTVADVPTAGDPVAVTLRPGSHRRSVVVEPWPFRNDGGSVSVRCEGQRLTQPVASAEALTAAIADAPWEPLQITLSGPE